MRIITFLILFLINIPVFAQETFPYNGVRDKREGLVAFTNAVIHVDHKQTIDNGTLIIREGRIEQVGKNINIPKGAVTVDLKGAHIYPSFIDLYSNYGLPEVKKNSNHGHGPQMETNTKGAYNWNQAIKPEQAAFQSFTSNKKQAEELVNLGFGAVVSHTMDGIARGTSVLVTLADERDNLVLLNNRASAHYSFDKGTSTQDYPGSLMGSIALLRQTFYDAQWYDKSKDKIEHNLSLQAFNNQQSLPQIFETTDKYSALRAAQIGKEFTVQYIIKGTGDEYQLAKELKNLNTTFIIPLDFPKAYDVEDPYDALNVNLTQMRHWEMAPANAAILEKEGVRFVFTSHGLKEKKEFLPNLRKAVQYGLSKEMALQALTSEPAKVIKAENQLGSISKGKLANFLITSDDIFDEKTVIYENWIRGNKNSFQEIGRPDLAGEYQITVGNTTFPLTVAGTPEKPELSIKPTDTTSVKVQLARQRNEVMLSFRQPQDTTNKLVRLNGWIENDSTWSGEGQMPNGDWVRWTAQRQKTSTQDKKEEKAAEKKTVDLSSITFPFTAYGLKSKPTKETVLIRSATVWTNESEGIVENTDVLIRDGKIAAVGKNLSAGNARVIDGTGKHVTAGIVDEHSHIAISKGVNEWTQASSAEVRIGDVINAEDVNIYRQLAGGVVASQLLHGSANPIGGQSAVIKLRWGSSPEEMKLADAQGYIKFALGENVKQSNWGDQTTVRYPQTRMGVEQVFQNYFTLALEYEQEWKNYNPRSKNAVPPRKDLELEALLEVLRGKRFVTCHSYVQSEINMLMKLAEEFDFRINTFTHILEGYKVADKMKEHGAHASTFADWWAFKMEVKDAIPYNAALLHRTGVLTGINSDDAEMGRRLNQEAAKIVKYGGLSEEEAWKLVTLNPAKMLRIDNKMGSLKAGKDADVVIWSDNPLSIYAHAEKTFVDGRLLYDKERDLQMRQEIQDERARLTQAMLASKQSGEPTQKPVKKEEKLWHCDDLHEFDHDRDINH